jgi:predicted RNA binding protein YcfA (HicA-like mRNA interferase family)
VIPPLPRGISGRQLVRLAERAGYQFSRGSGSHIIMTLTGGGEHHICIPDHKELSVGTLNDILKDMAQQLGIAKALLIKSMFD